MKTYKVIYKETLLHTFYVEANSEEEAQEVFEEGCTHGQFDFCDGWVDDTDYTIVEDNDKHHYHYTSEAKEE